MYNKGAATLNAILHSCVRGNRGETVAMSNSLCPAWRDRSFGWSRPMQTIGILAFAFASLAGCKSQETVHESASPANSSLASARSELETARRSYQYGNDSLCLAAIDRCSALL